MLENKISLTEDYSLAFDEDMALIEPETRYLTDALNVLYQKPEQAENHPLYYVYRGIAIAADQTIFDETKLRYDLTIIPPGLVEREYHKTIGHFHPTKASSQETFPEYHEILVGEALYLLQKNNRTGEAEEVRVIAAKKGDRIFIPPGFGHVTINPGDEVLMVGNLVNATISPLYKPFAEKQGAAYYYILTESDKADFVKNPRYTQSTGLEMVSAPSLPQPIDIPEGKSLYEAFTANPKLFNILK